MDANAQSSRTGARRSAPRVRGVPVAGSSIPLIRDPLGFLERARHEHGDVVRFDLPGQQVTLFSHPDAIEQVLVTERGRLIKDKFTRDLGLFLGHGLLVSEGAFWRRQRRLAQPAFHRERVAAYGETMVRYAERATARWIDGELRDVHVDLMHLTLEIVVKTLFGVDEGPDARQLETALDVLMDRFSGFGAAMPMWVPTPGNLGTRRAIAALDAFVYGLIAQGRRGGARDDLLSTLASASYDEGGSMTDTQLRDEALTMVLAGHETTALALGYALHLLARHPAVAARLADEVDAVLAGRPASVADLPRLTYADAVVREALRLFPPAWAIGREATEPCTIAGYDLPAGAQLWVSQWVVQRDPRWFDDPLSFDPGRWLGGLAKSLPRYAYFPFGGGPRVCIGNAFAMMEAVLVLVSIVRRIHVSAVDDRPLALAPAVTLRPKHGIPLVVHRRHAPRA